MIEAIGFYGMGLSLLVHVIFVSITIGVGLITAIYRWYGYKRNDRYYENFAKKGFRLMVISELFSGVWGTIITVFLAGLFPALMALATNVLFVPLLIALIGIMIRIPSIAIFWYTWNKVSPKIHSYIGFVMAASGFLIPFGFRAVFSEINYPVAIASYISTGIVSPFEAFISPLFWVFYAHTVFSALSVGGFVIASLMSIEDDIRGVEIGIKYGFAFLILNFLFGMFYWLFLGSFSPYIYNAVTVGTYAPLFVLKLLLIFLLFFIVVNANSAILSGKVHQHTKYAAPVSLLIAVIGEFMNGGARYPYMVVLGGDGIEISSFFNYYIHIPEYLLLVLIAVLLAAIVVFLLAASYALIKRYLDIPVAEEAS
uniref:Cytochrome oxidase subunit I n=1 Tax=Archaeoglobus fulgidus TaxID=2234 RepID=A0A7C3MBS4_ARCFL